MNTQDDHREYVLTSENSKLIDNILSDIRRDPKTGRLVVPALWKKEIQHLMSPNYNLAVSVLNSQKRKLSPERLKEYDAVIQNQFEDGVIERIADHPSFLRENPDVSFLAHNAVFRNNSNTTKCRVVFLSNLSERKNEKCLSHNQCSMAGANLNNKMQISTLLLRFDKYLLTYDLKKAFLQLFLREEDTRKLLFLWFNGISKNDFSIVGYRFRRVPFGMRYSPFLLMIALYYTLIHNVTDDDDEETQSIKGVCITFLTWIT
ncbi:uncharacterized protein [Macrobrachium rosenbergii]|uniref:uncharacterized protein n=1 Tax=Macrobrachium rosenbergii TaxID=79674 RepID=UPI0034D43FCB